jgi:hypothetical protein
MRGSGELVVVACHAGTKMVVMPQASCVEKLTGFPVAVRVVFGVPKLLYVAVSAGADPVVIRLVVQDASSSLIVRVVVA